PTCHRSGKGLQAASAWPQGSRRAWAASWPRRGCSKALTPIIVGLSCPHIRPVLFRLSGKIPRSRACCPTCAAPAPPDVQQARKGQGTPRAPHKDEENGLDMAKSPNLCYGEARVRLEA